MLLASIYEEAIDLEIDMRMMCEGKLAKVVSKRTAANNDKLVLIWNAYKDGHISGNQLLVKTSKLVKR